MKISITLLSAIAAMVALARPDSALAQISATGVEPILISGDASLQQIKDACGIVEEDASANRSPIPGSASTTVNGLIFSVSFTLVGTTLQFDDTTDPDQFVGSGELPKIVAYAVRRNSTNVYCAVRNHDEDLVGAGGGTGAPNEVTIVWAGPCPLVETDVSAVCEAYNPSTEDNVHFIHAQGPAPSVCGCPPTQVAFCDPAIPPGTPTAPELNSCNPEGGVLAGAPQGHTFAQSGTGSACYYCPSTKRITSLGGTASASTCVFVSSTGC